MKRDPGKTTYITCLLPPPDVRAAFMRAAAGDAPAGARMVREEDLHITMNELQLPRSRGKADLIQRLGAIEAPAFDLAMTDIDAFNRIARQDVDSHVAWLRPDGRSSWDIQELHKKIHLALRPAGYPVGRVEIRPHMKVLQYDFNLNAEALRGYLGAHRGENLPAWHVDAFYLVRRRPAADPLHPGNNGGQGSRYEIIARFPLAT